MNTEHSSMLATDKHCNGALNKIYGEAMASSVQYKKDFFVQAIRDYARIERFSDDNPCQILDMGSCTSALAYAMAAELPTSVRFIESDLDMAFLRNAKATQDEYARIDPNIYSPYRFSHVRANIAHIPLASESIHVAMHSSFLHEIYSYPVLGKPFNTDNLRHWYQEVHRVLTPGGVVIGRDYVVKPEDPEEELIVRVQHEEPVPHSSDGTRHFDWMSKFIHEFEPTAGLRDRIAKATNNTSQYQLPAWAVGEAMFHMQYRDDLSMWNSEIHEQYGESTISGMKCMVEEIGFKADIVEAKTHYDVSQGLGVQLFDLKNRQIDVPGRFPTNLYTVLEKMV